MNIAILLPYKENFTKAKAGAVSIFINDTINSNYRKNIKVYGHTSSENKFKNYINLFIKKNFFNR